MSTLKHLLVLLPLIIMSQSAHAQPGAVRWQPCTNSPFDNWFDAEPPEDLLCGYVEAPLGYSGNAKADKVRLALTRLPATSVKQGSVVVISGGPGLPGINPFLADDDTVARLTRSYDIIGYDPRGVGQSTPKISCALPERDEKTVIDENDAGALEAQVRKTLAACIEHTGAKVLQHMGTDDAVNDLDVIRAALGEPGLTAVAYSYGTQVAALYAERFPAQTRALVLDGVVDVSEDDYTQLLNQARGYQQTFKRFAAYCAKNRDCPLPSDEAGATKAFHQLLRQVYDTALITPDGDEVTADDLLTTTQALLLWSDRWPELMALLHKANDGIADEQVAGLIDENVGEDADDALSVISCADVAIPGRDVQLLRKQRQAIREASPFTNYLAVQQSGLELCDLWPWRGTLSAHVPVAAPSLPPLLFVGQRFDPTTPYINARQMAKWFKSPLVTREGDGHTLVLNGIDRCVDEAVVDYLLAPRETRTDKTCR
ncbi:alpha/beta hydrolase [Pseudomonas sp. P9_2]|uniref:alpha/beta hydrolase n=1 Tax=Pseudomonas sp. P9_2 TaxID=3043447 RepID=UPI002A363C09|nr:alpha/beta hydrolase [Pseudomonas sp. P9_2]WPN51118.1 alpha/beta hydrolase [Pseudomonas sp. P9_2]